MDDAGHGWRGDLPPVARGRRYDSVGRNGGEEFLVVLPAGDEGEVSNLGELFRLLISASPFTFGHSVLAITCSIGAPPSLPGTSGMPTR
jgi:GGDEF domain-containing protein